MERLTEKHYLGTDHYMKCSGSCNVDMDCIDCPSFDRLVERLAAYEDTGLEPESVEALKLSMMGKAISEITEFDGLPIDRLRELAEADKDGRVVVLPCKPDGSMLNASDPERPEIMKRVHFAVAYVCGGIVFHQPYNMFLENVAAGYIRPLNEKAEKALEAMKYE